MPEILFNHDVNKIISHCSLKISMVLQCSVSGDSFLMYGLFCRANVPLMRGHPVDADSGQDILVIFMSLLCTHSKFQSSQHSSHDKSTEFGIITGGGRNRCYATPG